MGRKGGTRTRSNGERNASSSASTSSTTANSNSSTGNSTVPSLRELREQRVLQVVRQWNAAVPVAEASTPPSLWYTCPEVAAVEKEAVFQKNWLAVGRSQEVVEP